MCAESANCRRCVQLRACTCTPAHTNQNTLSHLPAATILPVSAPALPPTLLGPRLQNCDLLRTRQSQAITQHTAAQWGQQRAERQAARGAEADAERHAAAEFERYMGAAEARYQHDQQRRSEARAQLNSLLDEQLARREEVQREEAAQEREEVRAGSGLGCWGAVP